MPLAVPLLIPGHSCSRGSRGRYHDKWDRLVCGNKGIYGVWSLVSGIVVESIAHIWFAGNTISLQAVPCTLQDAICRFLVLCCPECSSLVARGFAGSSIERGIGRCFAGRCSPFDGCSPGSTGARRVRRLTWLLGSPCRILCIS